MAKGGKRRSRSRSPRKPRRRNRSKSPGKRKTKRKPRSKKSDSESYLENIYGSSSGSTDFWGMDSVLKPKKDYHLDPYSGMFKVTKPGFSYLDLISQIHTMKTLGIGEDPRAFNDTRSVTAMLDNLNPSYSSLGFNSSNSNTGLGLGLSNLGLSDSLAKSSMEATKSTTGPGI